ncbi:MAG: ABC transporter permease [Bacteroidales bacterium]|nr:ABC transporter permease [Bacteroidales bacterium]
MTKLILENIRISLESIRSHLLRTILTVLIIAFGIMALVGILTSIDAIKYFLTENFTMMGANTFSIKNRSMQIQIGSEVEKARYYEPISFDEAMTFKENLDFPAYTSVYTFATHIATLKYKSEKTNPNVAVLGTDENYIVTSGNELSKGRNFSAHEVHYGSHVVILGSELEKKIFNENGDPIGKIISVGAGKYRVIGVLKEKGSSIGFSGDRNCLLPLNNVRQYFSRSDRSYTINIMTENPDLLESAIGEATGLLRVIRATPLGEDNDFEITKSDRLVSMLLENLKYIRYAAIFIGAITLMGAAIGLMNIMLVSVTERTREIGIRKAAGATKRTIKNQFLAETIVIAQIGGLLGVILGIGIGNVLSMIIGSSFIIPWVWIVVGLTLCLFVAVISGYLPATKAARLDPIESLRYE